MFASLPTGDGALVYSKERSQHFLGQTKRSPFAFQPVGP
jgi:hypothetical protein